MRNHFAKSLSIRGAILVTFIVTLIVAVTAISVLLFVNWSRSARNMTESMSSHMATEVYDNIDSMVEETKHINAINHNLISDGILDITNVEDRDKFFVGILNSHTDMVYSVAYGTAAGEYYGARRNEYNEIQIMRNDATTGGNSWYYAVNEDMTAGELAVQAGLFDPRTRPWYKAAEESLSPAFSPVYKHFIMDDLTISAGWPIFSTNGELAGVFVTHTLLSGMGEQLNNIVKKNEGFTLILEKDSGALVANSAGLANFYVSDEGVFVRNTIKDCGDNYCKVYQKYITENTKQFFYKTAGEKVNYSIEEYHNDGLNWVVISAVPVDLLMKSVHINIYITIAITLVCLSLALFVFFKLTKKLMRPLKTLVKTAESISSGNLSDRVTNFRNDELGKISKVFNIMADNNQYLINNLELTVEKRTEDLISSRERLRLLLDSAAEGIYGIDNESRCTFCNKSCLKMLGYELPEDLIGKKMHSQIHHSNADGSPLAAEKCKILNAIKNGEGVREENEVFWRADNSYFYVEYHAYPQIVNNKTIGAVVTFMDITERKKREEEIKYLSFHDTLTGLLNRRGYEKAVEATDIAQNLPITIIFADINGLKMTNDIFGHTNGDALIKESSRILKMFCREQDIISRVGGDEFVIIMSKTELTTGEETMQNIKSAFAKARIAAVKCSISLGVDTKTEVDQSLEEKMLNAEKLMYKDKTLNRKSVNKDIVETITDALHNKRNNEKNHSETVSELCRQMGEAMGLPVPEIKKLKQAGYFHDIGKVVLDDSLMTKSELSEEEREKMRQHSVVGYRILNLFDDTLDIADGVYSHHERWDGSGYPKGLKGTEIPLVSRVIAVTETYERIMDREKERGSNAREFALEEISKQAGTMFDPDIVKIFIKLIGN